MKFDVIGEPKGKARARTFYNPKIGKSQSVTPEGTVLYENLVKQSFLTAKGKETFFNKEPIQVDIIAFFWIPKSTSKKKRELMLVHDLLPTKKPDADNIAKVICDALNGVAYGDDSQIVALTVNKVYTDFQPRVHVTITKKEEGQCKE